MYGELITQFHGQEVVEFDDGKSWQGPSVAYRVNEEYDAKVKVKEKLDLLVQQPGIGDLSALIIGAWTGASEGENSSALVSHLVELAPQLPSLRHLFFGEMTYEECEISWIQQTDVSPLLRAFPKLESLRIRGGTGLSFSQVRHTDLKELAIETGGLGRSVLREIFLCDLPELKHLELLLGEENYGFDATVEDFQPLLSGRLFPKLKFLGLMNSTISNDIAAAIVNSPIVERIEILDLSLGNLDGEGVQSLHRLAAFKNLKRLNISHHYASEEQVDRLRSVIPFEVAADDRQELDDEWRPIVHAE